MRPNVGVGQGMELRNRALPIGASAHGTDGQRATMTLAVAPDKRVSNVGQARQQHFEADFIALLGFASVSLPGHSSAGAAAGDSELELGSTAAAERLS